MPGKTQAEGRLTQYLLGTLSESERESIESEYFADEDAFEQMLIAEDELVDAYARSELSAKERKQFEEEFLNSQSGRERVQFAHTLADVVSDARGGATTQVTVPKRLPVPFWAYLTRLRVAAVAVGVVLIVPLLWLFIERSSMRRELRELRAEHTRLSEYSEQLKRNADAERARSAELTAQLQAERERLTRGAYLQTNVSEPKTGGEVINRNQATARREPAHNKRNIESAALSSGSVEFTLAPGSTRGGNGRTLRVPSRAKFIVLKLSFEQPSTYEEYRAAIETTEGRRVWSIDFFGYRRRVSELDGLNLPALPAGDLSPGDYVLFLSGKRADGTFEPVANYSFRITRK